MPERPEKKGYKPVSNGKMADQAMGFSRVFQPAKTLFTSEMILTVYKGVNKYRWHKKHCGRVWTVKEGYFEQHGTAPHKVCSSN